MAEMNAASINDNWRELYVAALFESNKSKLPLRIANAEKKITAKARELFNSGDHDTMERSALNVALYALLALRSSLDRNESDSGSHSAVA
jgi:hypothetical protein